MELSLEEKEAIETVRQYKNCFVFETVHEETGERLNDYSNAIDIVLNLIKRQQKELEDLKQENAKLKYDIKHNYISIDLYSIL